MSQSWSHAFFWISVSPSAVEIDPGDYVEGIDVPFKYKFLDFPPFQGLGQYICVGFTNCFAGHSNVLLF